VSSAAPVSELLLGELGTEGLSRRTDPRILIGGLGLGFTLKSALGKVGPTARVQVAELLPEIVDWNQQFLSGLNGSLLEDPRVEILVLDLWEILTQVVEPSYDAVLLDVDNGPKAMVQKQNARLYTRDGLGQIAAVLHSGGRAVFWSADPDPDFGERLVRAGFTLQAVPARLYATAEHCAGTIYVADKDQASPDDTLKGLNLKEK